MSRRRSGALPPLNPPPASVTRVTRRGIFWAMAALVGIVVAAALTWSASQLAGQRIGLASEPLSVTNGLAPASELTRDQRTVPERAVHNVRKPHRARTAPPVQLPTTTVYVAPVPAPAAPAPAPVVTAPPATTASPAAPAPSHRDDNGGGGSGQGSGSSGGGRQRDD
jgi:hypothetical protein